MINHARTLLVNLDGAGSGFANQPGEEFIPPTFRAVGPLPSYLQSLRQVLFGGDPDRLLLNYRARQLLGLIHATELAEFVTELDPRVTYEPLPLDELFDALFETRVTPLLGTTRQLFLQELSPTGEAAGRLAQQWTVRVTSGTHVEVSRHTTPVSVRLLEYTLTDGLSNAVPLTGSSLGVKFEAGVGSQWYIEATTRPTVDLGELLANLDAVTEDVKLELFGVGSPRAETEPFRTFRNLYSHHQELPYRLGGLVLAIIYRMDELR